MWFPAKMIVDCKSAGLNVYIIRWIWMGWAYLKIFCYDNFTRDVHILATQSHTSSNGIPVVFRLLEWLCSKPGYHSNLSISGHKLVTCAWWLCKIPAKRLQGMLFCLVTLFNMVMANRKLNRIKQSYGIKWLKIKTQDSDGKLNLVVSKQSNCIPKYSWLDSEIARRWWAIRQ